MTFKFKIKANYYRILPVILLIIFNLWISLISQAQIILYDSCHQATPFCGNNIYNYNVGGISWPVALNECCPGDIPPQCCASYSCFTAAFTQIKNPRWFFFKVENPGTIIISLLLTPYVAGVGEHICWGPFDNPITPCVASLTEGKIVACCCVESSCINNLVVPQAEVGKYYLFALSTVFYQGIPPNYQPVQLTFWQSNTGQPDAGSTTCDLVTECNMLQLTANASACNAVTNTYTLSGKVFFVNPPQTGQLVIWDNVTGNSLSFNAPFTSPLSYNFAAMPCDNLQHTLTASFWNAVNCEISTQYQAPVLCPDATLSGGGAVCNNGTDQVAINISFTPNSQTPYSFAWAVDGVAQPMVQNYSGPFPYTFLTSQPGVYTLLTSQNLLCQGQLTGQATVSLLPLPSINLGSDILACAGTPVMLDAGPGFSTYTWSNLMATQSISVSLPGEYTVTVMDANGCQASDTVIVQYMPAISPVNIKHY